MAAATEPVGRCAKSTKPATILSDTDAKEEASLKPELGSASFGKAGVELSVLVWAVSLAFRREFLGPFRSIPAELDLITAGFRNQELEKKANKPLFPFDVGLLGPTGVGFKPHHLPFLIQQPDVGIGNEPLLGLSSWNDLFAFPITNRSCVLNV